MTGPRPDLGPGARLSDDDHRLADDEPPRFAVLAQAGLPADLPADVPLDSVSVREAEPSDADRVLKLMEDLTRPAVAEDPQPQRDGVPRAPRAPRLPDLRRGGGRRGRRRGQPLDPAATQLDDAARLDPRSVRGRGVSPTRRGTRASGRVRRGVPAARLPRADPRVGPPPGGGAPPLRVVRLRAPRPRLHPHARSACSAPRRVAADGRRRAPRRARASAASAHREARGRRCGSARGAAVPPCRAFPGAACDPRRTGDHRRRAARSPDTERRSRSPTGRPGCSGRRAGERRHAVGASDDSRRRRARPEGGCATSSRASFPTSSAGASPASSKCTMPPIRISWSSERAAGFPLRVNRALVETDLVLVVSAAESVLHGGPAALLAASDPVALRAAGAYSLLETAASPGWRLGNELERELSKQVPLIGASLSLNPPVVTGAFHGYPHDDRALRADRGVAGPACVPDRSGADPNAPARFDPPRADGDIRARRPAVDRARRGASAQRRGSCGSPRGAAGRRRRRDSGDHAPPAPRTTEPCPRRLPRARPGAPALARRLPGRGRRHRDPPQPVRPAIPASEPVALPDVLQRAARTRLPRGDGAAGARRRRARSRLGRARDRRVPDGPSLSPGPPVLRVGRLPARGASGSAPSSSPAAETPRPRASSASSRPRNLSTALSMAKARVGGTPRVGFVVAPPYFPIRTGPS